MRRVGRIVTGEGGVVDGNYSTVRDLAWTRADTVVWFDLPRRTVMCQVLLRTLRRTLTRVELWNGNREPITGLFRLDPRESLLRWAWTRHETYHRRFSAAARDPVYAHLSFVRIGSRADGRRLLAAQPGSGTPSPAAAHRHPGLHRAGRWVTRAPGIDRPTSV